MVASCQKRNAEGYNLVETGVETVKLQAYSPQKGALPVNATMNATVCILYQNCLYT